MKYQYGPTHTHKKNESPNERDWFSYTFLSTGGVAVLSARLRSPQIFFRLSKPKCIWFYNRKPAVIHIF